MKDKNRWRMTGRDWTLVGIRGLLFTALIFGSLIGFRAFAAEAGSATFGGLCVACHTIGGGKLI
ncbi:MAG: hypothetical protein ACC642_05995, partial [Pseudomonadales bacterium]